MSYGAAVELVATGRTAEVFALDGDRVVKLDRPEWNGLSDYEAGVVRAAHAAGLPVPAVFETVTINGRRGVVLERLYGPKLSEILDGSCEIDNLAGQFVGLQSRLQAVALPGLPDLVARLDDELDRSGLSARLRAELHDVLTALAHRADRRVCHYDFHPDNIIVTDRGWVVIDWLTAAAGPPSADFARSLLLRAHATDSTMVRFVAAVRRLGQQQRSIDDGQLRAWTRVVAAARLAEGFDGSYAAWLTDIASSNL